MSALATQSDRRNELVYVANSEHIMADRMLKAALPHLIASGEALIELKKSTPPGQWISFCQEHIVFGKSKIQAYMRIALYKDQLEGSEGFSEARDKLRGLPSAPRGASQVTSDDISRALELRKKGLSLRAIGKEMGLPLSSVQYRIVPGFREKSLEYSAEQGAKRTAEKRRRDEERKALLILRRTAAAQGFGGGVAESYSLCRRLLQVLDKVHRDGDMPDTRRLAGIAYTEMLKVEDYIGRMVGVA